MVEGKSYKLKADDKKKKKGVSLMKWKMYAHQKVLSKK